MSISSVGNDMAAGALRTVPNNFWNLKGGRQSLPVNGTMIAAGINMMEATTLSLHTQQTS